VFPVSSEDSRRNTTLFWVKCIKILRCISLWKSWVQPCWMIALRMNDPTFLLNNCVGSNWKHPCATVWYGNCTILFQRNKPYTNIWAACRWHAYRWVITVGNVGAWQHEKIRRLNPENETSAIPDKNDAQKSVIKQRSPLNRCEPGLESEDAQDILHLVRMHNIEFMSNPCALLNSF
jgi:hypothetical protein